MDTDSTRDLLQRIGRNIKAERARSGKRQDEVAHNAGLAVAQYARMERGEVDSGVSRYVRVAQALEVPVTALFQGIA